MEKEKPELLNGIPEVERFPWDGKPSVYFLVLDGRIMYVGRTIGLGSRINDHRKDKAFDQVYFVSIPPGENINKIEIALIRYLSPPWNGTNAKFRKSDHDLLGRLWPEFLNATSPQIKTSEPIELKSYGAVQVVRGRFLGQIGYYDDDEAELINECADCKSGGDCEGEHCKYEQLAIVYFGKWTDGYELIPHGDLRPCEKKSDVAKKVLGGLKLAPHVMASMGIE